MQSGKVSIEWLLFVAVGITFGAVLALWYLADSGLNREYDVPRAAFTMPSGPEVVAEGERLAQVRGCFWCHGPQLEGQKYFAEHQRGLIVVAPDLTRKIREYTPAEFARTVRNGVRPDNTSLQPAMPSFAFYNMSDPDMGAIMAYIESLPEQQGLEGEFRLLPLGWWRWVAGELPPNVAELIDHEAPRPDPAVDGDPVARGRYLAESICTECHSDGGRIRVPGSPDLIVASAYNRADFFRLMREGITVGERDIDYHMVDASKYRYTYLYDNEVDALYAYFRSLASAPVDVAQNIR
ncbi:MAG: c-type cytochrome [Gammaproteobacteria bacterium]|nr:c-type cytochrome [Gammaproteobacteria bacterium]